MGKVMAHWPPIRRTGWRGLWRASGGRSWRATREIYRSARGAEKHSPTSIPETQHRLTVPTATDEASKAAIERERRDGPCHLTSPDRADARRPSRTTDAADHAGRPLCARPGLVQGVPASARCGPASPDRRRARRRAAGRVAVPLLELRQWPHGFRGDGDRGDGPAAVIAARFLGAIVGHAALRPTRRRWTASDFAKLLQSHNSGLTMLSSAQGSVVEKTGGGAQPHPSSVRAIGERPSHAHRHRRKHAGERTYAFAR